MNTYLTKVAVIYYSATGNVHALAEAVADGAAEAGAQVRLHRVPELAPAEVIDSSPAQPVAVSSGWPRARRTRG